MPEAYSADEFLPVTASARRVVASDASSIGGSHLPSCGSTREGIKGLSSGSGDGGGGGGSGGGCGGGGNS